MNNIPEDLQWCWRRFKTRCKNIIIFLDGLGLHEMKQNKPWFDEECLGFFGSKEAG